MESLNEVMPKKYEIRKNGSKTNESNDLGSIMGLFMQIPNGTGIHELVDTTTGKVLHSKGERPGNKRPADQQQAATT